MTALLYYSISSDLAEDEIIEVDRRVAKDREAVYTFVRDFAANGKDGIKTKRIILIIALVSVVWLSNLESVSAVGLPIPPALVVRVHPNYQYDSNVQIAKVIPRKKDLIVSKLPKIE